MRAVVHYLLAILEGGLSGALFYYAGQEKLKERKVLMYLLSAGWFLLSLTESFEGGREWKKSRSAKTELINASEGEYDDE